uniref:uncharacterized protein LOC120335994 n=1 Tax=Styela clava TaxID=7725 RepID=UPI001939C0E0|nr:uncharacterized protein LOC120335994 [Styela clava]
MRILMYARRFEKKCGLPALGCSHDCDLSSEKCICSAGMTLGGIGGKTCVWNEDFIENGDLPLTPEFAYIVRLLIFYRQELMLVSTMEEIVPLDKTESEKEADDALKQFENKDKNLEHVLLMILENYREDQSIRKDLDSPDAMQDKITVAQAISYQEIISLEKLIQNTQEIDKILDEVEGKSEADTQKVSINEKLLEVTAKSRLMMAMQKIKSQLGKRDGER